MENEVIRQPAGMVLTTQHVHQWKPMLKEMHGHPCFYCSHCGDEGYDPNSEYDRVEKANRG